MAAAPVVPSYSLLRCTAVGRIGLVDSIATKRNCRPSNQATVELEVPKSTPTPIIGAFVFGLPCIQLTLAGSAVQDESKVRCATRRSKDPTDTLRYPHISSKNTRHSRLAG